jgi:hypothetical protein
MRVNGELIFVIPAQAGIQPSKEELGSRLRGNDEVNE